MVYPLAWGRVSGTSQAAQETKTSGDRQNPSEPNLKSVFKEGLEDAKLELERSLLHRLGLHHNDGDHKG